MARERFDKVITEIPDVQLKTEPGIRIDILRKTIGDLYKIAIEFARYKFQIDALKEKLQPKRKLIIDIAGAHEGLRGIISKNDNFDITATCKREITYNQEPLRESLGDAYTAFVIERLVMTLSIPAGLRTKDDSQMSQETLRSQIERALVDLGVPEDDLPKIISQSTELTVDEKTLNQKVQSGEIKLQEGAKTTKTVWEVTGRKLKK